MQTGGDKHNKDLAELFHNLAGLYARNGRLRKAIDNYKRAVEFLRGCFGYDQLNEGTVFEVIGELKGIVQERRRSSFRRLHHLCKDVRR